MVIWKFNTNHNRLQEINIHNLCWLHLWNKCTQSAITTPAVGPMGIPPDFILCSCKSGIAGSIDFTDSTGAHDTLWVTLVFWSELSHDYCFAGLLGGICRSGQGWLLGSGWSESIWAIPLLICWPTTCSFQQWWNLSDELILCNLCSKLLWWNVSCELPLDQFWRCCLAAFCCQENS